MNTNDQKKPKVMTEFAPPANAGMTGSDYSVGRGLDAGGSGGYRNAGLRVVAS